MTPSVFISSTISDLRHVRDAVRGVIEEIGFQPVMSEYGEVGYMSGGTAESSCYRSVRDCQIMVLIIGSRYGSESEAMDGMSVTEKEFGTFQDTGGHLITLVAKDTLRYKRIFDVNKGLKGLTIPDMDDAPRVFRFIDQISAAGDSNGIITYENVADIKCFLKRQIGDLVYRALTGAGMLSRNTLTDILSEVQTLRNALSKTERTRPSRFFLRATRFLLDDNNADFSKLLKRLSRVDRLIEIMEESKEDSFGGLCNAIGVEIEILPLSSLQIPDLFERYNVIEVNQFFPVQNIIPLSSEERRQNFAYCIVAGAKKVMLTDATNRYFEAIYASAVSSFRADD